MILSDLVAEISVAYKGRDKQWAEGTDKWDRAVTILNRKRREWARDADVSWRSLYSIETIGTFSTTQTYNLASDINKLGDFVYLEDGNNWKQFSVISPLRRREYSQACYVTGINPQVLTFIDTISATDPWIGSDIKAGAYSIPADVTTGSSEVTIDNPEWLIYATAAELARNDPAKDDQFDNLLGMANDLYQKMKDANDELGYGQPFDVPVEVIQTGESWS